MDKYSILSVIAPIAAPAAPATMLVNILYGELIREAVNQNVAIGAAVLSGLGAEASGMIAAYVGIQAYRKQKYGLMVVSIIAFLSYAIFMAIGISAARDPLTMVSTIVISIIAYVSVGVLTDLRDVTSEKAEEVNMDINLMAAQRLLANAEARRNKSVQPQPPTSLPQVSAPPPPPGPSSQSTGIGHGRQFTGLSDDHIADIRDYWKANPDATLRQAAQACGCSPITAGKYKP